MPEQIVCVRDTKVTKFSGFTTFVEKRGKVLMELLIMNTQSAVATKHGAFYLLFVLRPGCQS